MAFEHQDKTMRLHDRGRSWRILIFKLGVPVLTVVGCVGMSAMSTHAQDRWESSDDSRSPVRQAADSDPRGNFALPDNRQSLSNDFRTVDPREMRIREQPRSPVSYPDPYIDRTVPGTYLRPVIETSFREETHTVQVPVTDRQTGETTMETQRRTRMVPVQTTRMIAEPSASTGPLPHDPRVFEIINELRVKPASLYHTAADNKKLSEVRALLQREFDKKHEQQASEIAAAEKRIADLKAKHEQRGKNCELIINRRIDQLLGKPNPLDWDVSSPGQQNPNDNDLRSNANRQENSFQPRNLARRGLLESQPREKLSLNINQSPLADLDAMFSVISQLGEAKLAEQSTKLAMESTKKLSDEGRVPQNEFQKVNLAYETAKQRAAILEHQVTAMRGRLEAQIGLARARLQAASEQPRILRSQGTRVEQGNTELELLQAEIKFERAEAKLAEYEETVKRFIPVGPANTSRTK